MPVNELPPSAQAMYSTWWSTVQTFANQVNPDTGRPYSVTDVSAAASILHQQYPGNYPSFSPPGVSSLYSQALGIIGARNAIGAAGPGDAITTGMVAVPPWAGTAAEMAAAPTWQARMEITYTDSEGVQQTGITTVIIPQILPTTVGSLQAQMELRVQDQLSSPPGTGTPRSGSLDSIDSITLLAV